MKNGFFSLLRLELISLGNITIFTFQIKRNHNNINNSITSSPKPYFYRLKSEVKYLKLNENLNSFLISLVDGKS